ncbi:hypothetical protein [Solwaraspora sp. WMMA2065]|uniref:hypothetical protein n=1 Tax=Solwaraspora sp. WMMA2065 TaxID=3015166 RepID=UPI00259B5E53|nr:hypothetical protein [Solwaraspora sp. WMMA2065]WJK33144.1 hypothetical protein O7610_20835 [Solwaraspora sp. WMMA2065]
MSDRSRSRPSHRARVPGDVTDPLLWRLAVDVLTAHQPGPDGRCLMRCPDHTDGLCPAARQARRAMRVARAPMVQPVARPDATRDTSRHPARAAGRFTGWFTAGLAATATHLRSRLPHPLPRRVPGATLANVYAA